MSKGSSPPTSHTNIIARCLRGMFVATALLVGAGADLIGQLYLVLVLSLPLAVAVTIPARLWSAIRRQLAYDFIRRPLKLEYRKYLWQFILRSAACTLCVACLLIAVPRVAMSDTEFVAAMLISGWIPAGLLLLLQLIPAKHISRSMNALYAVAAVFLSLQLFQVYMQPRFSEPIAIQPPFRGQWVVLQGGRSSLINHHYPLISQRYALDMLALEDGKHMHGDPQLLESYASFNQPLYVPAGGRVVVVVNDQPDQAIGASNPRFPVGNHVVIDMGHERFVMLAHLREGSVVVQEGDEVKVGDLIAHCGNSGNTSEPHLHLQIQNRADFFAADLETYPIRFDNVTVTRGGKTYTEQPGELRRNDRIVTTQQDAESEIQ